MMLFPLILKMKSYMPGIFTTDEPFGWLAYFWWQKYAFSRHLAETYYSVIAFPFGMDISSQILYPVSNFISRWLAVSTGNIFTYNIQVVFSFVASGITMFYLAFILTKNKIAALFAGIVYAFCPYHFARAWQHLLLAQIQWMPLYILTLIKLQERPGYKYMLLNFIALFLVVSFEFHYTYFMYLSAGLLFVYYPIFYRKIDAQYRRSLLMALLVMMAGIAFVVSTSAGSAYKKAIIKKSVVQPSAWEVVRPFDNLFAQSARPLSYFLPAVTHPVFGNITESFIGTPFYGESITEHTLYLGWLPMILAFVAFRRWRKARARGQSPKNGDSPLVRENFYIGFFILLAIVAWLFSQPPWWQIGPFKIYMPSFFMYKILPMIRAYCRFGILLMLAISVLAAFGLNFVMEKFKRNSAKIAVAAGISILLLFEFWNWPPLRVIDVKTVPQVYHWLKKQPADIVIAEYPLDANSPNEKYKFYQSVHEKRMINGTTPGTGANHAAQALVNLSEKSTTAQLRNWGVKYVIVHRDNYVRTELVDVIAELERIPQNPDLRLIQTFPPESCPDKDVICMGKTGQIDVYQIQ